METMDLRIKKEFIKELLHQDLEIVAFNKITYVDGYWADEKIILKTNNNLYVLSNEFIVTDVLDIPEEFGNFQLSKLCLDNSSMLDFCDSIDIKSEIKKTHLLNEHQIYKHKNENTYEMYITRGILFDFGDEQLMVMKEVPDLFDEIFIKKDKNLFDYFEKFKNLVYEEDNNDKDSDMDIICNRELIVLD